MKINQERAQGQGIRPIVWIIGVIVLLLVAACGGVLIAQMTTKPTITQGSDSAISNNNNAADEGYGNTIVYEGETYQYNKSITTILFMGIDQAEEDRIGTVTGGGRSDAMMLLMVDSDTGTTKMLQISRDTMVNVDFYDINQSYSYSAEMQITMQYAAGNSAKRSCWLSANKVSETLYGVPIDYTVSVTMDGIETIVNAIGGVELTIPKDYTAVNPLFVEGSTLLLDGDLAVDYIHNRDINTFGSNNGRMDRQIDFLRALVKKLKASDVAKNAEILQKAASPFMESNLSAEVIDQVANYDVEDTIYFLPGENVEGEHDEFYLDDAAVRALLIELFYEPVE